MMINYSFGLDGTSVSIPVQLELKEVERERERERGYCERTDPFGGLLLVIGCACVERRSGVLEDRTND